MYSPHTPSRASTLPSGNRYAAACLPLRRQSPHPLFWKRLHDCLPPTLLQSGRDPIAAFSNSRPFLDYREGGQRRSGSRARTCLHGAPLTTTCTLRRMWRSGGLGTDAKLMLPVWQPALSKMEMGKEQGLVAKGCGCCRPLIPKSSRRNSTMRRGQPTCPPPPPPFGDAPRLDPKARSSRV